MHWKILLSPKRIKESEILKYHQWSQNDSRIILIKALKSLRNPWISQIFKDFSKGFQGFLEDGSITIMGLWRIFQYWTLNRIWRFHGAILVVQRKIPVLTGHHSLTCTVSLFPRRTLMMPLSVRTSARKVRQGWSVLK